MQMRRRVHRFDVWYVKLFNTARKKAFAEITTCKIHTSVLDLHVQYYCRNHDNTFINVKISSQEMFKCMKTIQNTWKNKIKFSLRSTSMTYEKDDKNFVGHFHIWLFITRTEKHATRDNTKNTQSSSYCLIILIFR